MIVKYLVLFALLLTPALSHAGFIYNPIEKRWESVRETLPGEKDVELKYNHFENEWSYERPDSEPEYNYFEDKWEHPK